MRMRTALGALVGAGAALAGYAVTRDAPPKRQREAAAVGLVAAAAVYPVARRGHAGSAAEVATLAAATGLAGASLVLPERRGRRLLAVAWLSHAAFDAAFTPSHASRIPSWYPAACAAYDGVLAVTLLLPARTVATR